MKKIHLLFSGPIRPCVEYVIYLNNLFHRYFDNYFNVITYLHYWEETCLNETDVDIITQKLNKHFDYTFTDKIESDDEIYAKIPERTVQQKLTKLVLGMYKMFLGMRYFINKLNEKKLIQDDEIVVRIRTDLFIQFYDIKTFASMVENIQPDEYFVRNFGSSMVEFCDWFGVTYYKNFVKGWYIGSDDEYRRNLKRVFNAEDTVKKNVLKAGLKIKYMNEYLRMAIVRHPRNKKQEMLLGRKEPYENNRPEESLKEYLDLFFLKGNNPKIEWKFK